MWDLAVVNCTHSSPRKTLLLQIDSENETTKLPSDRAVGFIPEKLQLLVRDDSISDSVGYLWVAGF